MPYPANACQEVSLLKAIRSAPEADRVRKGNMLFLVPRRGAHFQIANLDIERGRCPSKRSGGGW
ncbi:hypothetical protein MES5069_550045 [Mesorhizobium escarrei]|uniref:Uncharacterized protein n=1 Tax=Mesorhizobium escarrei TaxID=666018 RepID=A0ABN8KDX5_9HYPH|nr:hypothetical protein MES5069_550045 [Mesorhizobium escarrei]